MSRRIAIGRLGAAPLVLLLLLMGMAAAKAQAASPGWKVLGITAPTHLPPEEGSVPGAGKVVVYASNVGGAATDGTQVTVTINLPTGISPSGPATGGGWTCSAIGPSITCIRTAAVPAGRTAPTVTVPVSIDSSAAAQSAIPVTVGGGGAAAGIDYTVKAVVSAEPAKPGIQAFWAGAFTADGVPATAAGGHPHSAAAGFLLNTVLTPGGNIVPAGDLKDVHVGLPPGFIGNPTVTPRCPGIQPVQVEPETFATCPTGAAVGLSQAVLQDVMGGDDFQNQVNGRPIFNDKPPSGYPASFAFSYASVIASLVGELRSDSDYGVTVVAPNVPIFNWTYGAFTSLEGSPAGAAGKAFLTNPTNCAEQAQTTPLTSITTNTWQQPAVLDQTSVTVPPVIGCDQLEFEPSFAFQPSAASAATGVATTAQLHVDQEGLLDSTKLAPPHLKRSVVTLPSGLTLNPAAADGLQACSTDQVGLLTTSGAMPNPIRFDKSSVGCPDASKLGTAEIRTPLLEDPLAGTVYLAAQGDNPFNSLLAMYIVVDDPETGTVVKLPGEVKPDAQTGQLTAVFDNNPQIPFEDLTLSFRGGGPRSTLATPDVCGTYTTRGEFTPWSAPESGPPAQTQNSFEITSGPGGGACPRTKAERPFNLGFEAGSMNTAAGADSPFTLRITRPDGNQELDRITVSTPPGLIASLKGIASCSEAQLAAAQAPQRTGREEIESPSCPASSQVGTTTIGAGVGSSPLYVKTGKVFLAGPYKGAALSLAFVVPAVAGPFDLGVQVVRTALRINPKTAQVTAESDPIPQILKGIPLLVRDVRVDLDRPGFVRNPTNCESLAVAGQVTGGSGAVANLTSRFQVGNCGNLGFQPKLKLQLKGGTKRNRYQQLTATLTARPGDANIAGASVRFPQSIFLAQEHIGTVCTRVQFAARSCPPRSVYGEAEAVTPLLDQPLRGPVYLRSSDNVLPDLVAALRGPDNQPIEVELVGRTDSKNRGLRNTFDVVPDAPVSEFTLRMMGGKKSLLITSRNICLRKERAFVKMRGQNGATRSFRPVLQAACKKSGGKSR